MARPTPTSYKEIFHAFGILILVLMFQKSNAYEFKVGGSTGWAVPSDPNANSYNQWAEKSRFQIGDTLLFAYPADKDSVLHVSKEDYTNCNTETPLEKYTDGHTVFQFNHSGPHCFISGIKENCQKNEKLTVIVMADRSARNSSNHQTILAPPPTNVTTLAPPPNATITSPPLAPPVEMPPSPAPTGEEAPSPPYTTPAPSDLTPPPSGASTIAMNFIGSVGAFIGSYLLLVF